MKIKTEDLEKLFSLVIKKLKESNIQETAINEDNYKTILTSEWHNMYEDVEPAIGSLNDDWESLQKVLDKENPFTFLDLERLASILREVSEQAIK